tara:strand:+ start:131 stop:448 length:318 start_codon:yes stop_codon:yes gene_type:complete
MKIFLEEEYGFRYWLWDTDKDKEAVLSWWAELETVIPFFYNPAQTLPFGKVSPLDDTEAAASMARQVGAEAYMHLHEDEDSFLRVDKKNFFHKGHKKQLIKRGKV